MIRFEVSTLVEARPGATSSLNVDTGPMCLDDLSVEFLRGDLSVTRVQSGILVQGTIESQLRIECVRCLELVSLPVRLELEETFRLPGSGGGEAMPYAVSSNGWLDLAPLLREVGWLEIPMKPLCGPGCGGLCSGCGASLDSEPCSCEEAEIDPRWAALRDIAL